MKAAKNISDKTFKLLVETVKDYGIFMLDPEGHIQTWNEGACNIKGYTSKDIIGKHFSVFYDMEDIQAGKPEFELKEAIKVGRFEDEGWRIRKDGSRFWANVIITPLYEDAKLIGFSKVTRDLSDRKKLQDQLLATQQTLEQLLAETQTRLSIALHAADLGVFDWDVPNNKVYWSDTFLKIWGYDREDFPGTMEGVKERMHPDDVKLFEEAVRKSFEDGENYNLDYRIILPDQSIRWINGKGQAIHDSQGKVIRFTGAGADITERKITEQRNKILAQAGVILSSTLEYQINLQKASQLLIPLFCDSVVVYFCREKNWNQFFLYPESSFPISPPSFKTLMRERTIFEEKRIITVMEVHGEILGAITYQKPHFIQRDQFFAEQFAERLALAIDAGRLYQDAQDAIRVREEVVAIVSHDLKNPLNAVLLNTSLLLKTEDRSIKTKVERIKRSAQRMQSMIEDILDVTKLEAGTFSIESHSEDVEYFAREAVDLHRSLAEEKQIKLNLEFANQPGMVRCDHQRILQVLSNLIGNAIKFTPVGESITVNVLTSTEEVTFAIIDSGPGIAEDKISHIFDRYWQAKSTHKMGAGLGLFIAKSIVEAHGGRIWVESQEGSGAKFIFTIPL